MTPWKFKCSKAEVYYNFQGSKFSPLDYMSRNPVTGLLIAKDDQIIFERYQYARTDQDRRIPVDGQVDNRTVDRDAISEGAIKSINDIPESYVPGFMGSETAGRRFAICCTCPQAWISVKQETEDRPQSPVERYGDRVPEHEIGHD